jgi:hypothetical protein
MSMNEADTRYHLIDPVLRDKGYVSRDHITLETVLTPPPVEPSGPKGRRRKGPGRTDYLLCVKVDDAPKPMPVAVLEAKKEAEDPLKGMQQARGYADTLRFDVKYVFSTNGHRYGEYDRFTELINGPSPFCDFPSHPDLTARYCKDTGIDLIQPGSAMLFQADSAAWSQSRYYQDAAIRASFEKILLDRQAGKPPRVLLTLATGAGKTIIATNLLWRLSQAGQLPKPALFLCDRDELREQAYTKLKAAFGDNARIVRTERGSNAAANARIHIATYQTLGLDDEEGFASFLTEHYGEDAFSVIIIDECHRSAWGRWSEVLRRNPSAIHIGLTATPRKLEESDKASKEDQEITAKVYWDDAAFLSQEDAQRFPAYTLAAGDVLISLDRPVISSGVKVARVCETDVPALLLQRVGRFILDPCQIDPAYLYAFLQTSIFIAEVSGHEQSLGVPHISPAQVEAIQIPSYARQLARRGTPEADSRWSWTVDFAARRAKAREDMQPLLDDAAKLKAEVVDLKEQLKRLKKEKAADDVLEAHDAQIREKDKAARDLEAQAAAIDAAVFDLKAVNPNAVATVDDRTPAEIIASIDAQGRIVAQALGRLSALLQADAQVVQD